MGMNVGDEITTVYIEITFINHEIRIPIQQPRIQSQEGVFVVFLSVVKVKNPIFHSELAFGRGMNTHQKLAMKHGRNSG